MSQAASQAAAFYREVAETGKVWTIRDAGGYPAPKGDGGKRAQPFWSSLGRVERVISTVPAYAGFEPDEITWDKFLSAWVPGLTRDGILVGINWSGERALGYDVEPEQVARNVAAITAGAAS
jgi:hypothetical protein